MSKVTARWLITGASGFVGRALCEEAASRGVHVRGATRNACHLPGLAENVIVSTLDGETSWAAALHDVDVVIHLAARVHVMKDVAADPLAEFLGVNMRGTANLAHQAAAAGVKRLVYVSSVKVNGERTTGTQAFTESDDPAPQDAYAISKWRAEQVLQRVARESGLEVVILRPPLVYGSGVKGNFIKLLAAVDKGIPLPFAGVHNRRSLIYLGNLVDALILCARHPAATGRTYLVRDGEDISTPDLVRQMAMALERPARQFPVPVRLLRGLGSLFGKTESIERIVGSLCVDDDLIRRELGWKPRFTLRQGMQAMALWYRAVNKVPD